MSSPQSKVYTQIIDAVDKVVPNNLRPLWMHPAVLYASRMFSIKTLPVLKTNFHNQPLPTGAIRYIIGGLWLIDSYGLCPKTVFFWAPLFKFGLVFSSLGDMLDRPANTISARQSAVLAVTGLIWSRYSLVIIPKNYSLFTVNFAVFLLQSYQTYRAFTAT